VRGPQEVRVGQPCPTVGWPLFRRPSDGTALRSDEQLFGGFFCARKRRRSRLAQCRHGADRRKGGNRAHGIVKNVPTPYWCVTEASSVYA